MIAWCVRRSAVIWAACACILTAGAVSFSRLSLATKTEVELPRISVGASWAGASPELMEMYVTSPIEAAIQGVRDVKRVTSNSRDGSSSLTVELESDANVQLTRLAILERMESLRTDSAFPPGVGRPYVSNYTPENLAEAPLMQITMTGPYTPGALQKLLKETVTPRLAAVPGVASISAPQGGTDLGVSINYDAQRLRQLGLAPDLLSSAIANARMVRSLGEEKLGASVRAIVLRDQPRVIEDLEALPIRAPSGRVFRLGELAEVRAEEDTQGRFYRIDGFPALAISITREPRSDAIRTAAAIEAAMAELAPQLPAGTHMKATGNESVNLKKELNDLTKRGAIAFVAVLIVLALLLLDTRAVILVMGSTAVAIAGTALSLFVLKIPANLLTLAGLGMGVGILVQDALIVVNRLRTAPATPDGRISATSRITPAVVGSTLTTGVVLFPFLYLQGNARAAFMPFASAFLLALAWSVITAICVVPALSGLHVYKVRRWHWGRWFYARIVGWTLRLRWLTLAVAVIALAGLSWVFVKKVPRYAWSGGFGQQRTTLSVYLSFPRGSDPTSLDKGIQEFERIVGHRPEIEQVVTSGGGASASMRVLFTDEGAFTAVPLELQEELTQRAVFVGGATISVYGQGPGFSAGSGGSTSSTFRIKILGYSYSGVERLALDLKARLEGIPRVRDVNTNVASLAYGGQKSYQVTLEPDRNALARFGITSALFGAVTSREMRSQSSQQYLEIGGEEIPVQVKAQGARERSLDELREALVPNALRSPVRIADLARIDEKEALAVIQREDQQYIRVLSYDFRGPAKLATRTHTTFMKSISVPPGYTVAEQTYSWGGEDNSEKGLWLVFAIGIALVILTVALVFDSVWAAAMVFLSLPLPLGGVVAAFWFFKAAFTRDGAVGVILVIGLAVHQAILLVDAALWARRRREAAGLRKSLDAGAIVRAALDRTAMIVLVTFSALASLLPLSIGTPTNSMFGAIALATAGGTVAGTIGTLFVMPAMLFGRRGTKRKPRKWLRWLRWFRWMKFWGRKPTSPPLPSAEPHVA